LLRIRISNFLENFFFLFIFDSDSDFISIIRIIFFSFSFFFLSLVSMNFWIAYTRYLNLRHLTIYSKNRDIDSKFLISLISVIIVETEILIKIGILTIVKKIFRKLNFIPILTFFAICYYLADILSIIRMILPGMTAIKSAFKIFLLQMTGIVSILNIILLKTIRIM
jgi:hypothetical protein